MHQASTKRHHTTMSFPQTAEGVTKYLRSKNISTVEIYDVSIGLLNGQYDFYFPNGHIFLLELIIDRWNDVKNTSFRSDVHIWQLWKMLWDRLESEDHRKKLLKHLRLVSVIQLTLERMDDTNQELCEMIYQMLKATNACMTTAFPAEVAVKVLGRIIEVVLSCNFEGKAYRKQDVINEFLALTDLSNVEYFSKKVPIAYTNHLLLPSLRYFEQVEDEDVDDVSMVLSGFMKQFLFGSGKSSATLMKSFCEQHKEKLSSTLIKKLFQKCIHFLSKTDSKQLEEIFKLLIEIDPVSSSSLLDILRSSKKTMSQPFLESLFDDAYNTKNWIIIKRIIKLDIEIGIINTERLMKLLEQCDETVRIGIWSTLVTCHVNAREFEKLIQIWKSYCQKESSSVYFNDTNLTQVLSKNVVVLSISQLRTLLTELVETIITERDVFTIKILKVIVIGIDHLSYKNSLELKAILSKLFEIEKLNNSAFWELKYHILEIYDDLLSPDHFKNLDLETLIQLDENEYSSDLFFTVFKFRELQIFDLSLIIKKFMTYFKRLDSKSTTDVISSLFHRWSTIVDLTFDKPDIEFLTSSLLKQDSSLVFSLFESEDFFEESNIMHCLVSHLVNELNDLVSLHYIMKIPIQCLNKNFRLSIIDKITAKSTLKQDDVDVLGHVLQNPTFKSKLETDYETLLKFSTDPIFQYDLCNPVITRVWENQLLQMKDEKSSAFINQTLDNITKSLKEKSSHETYNLAHLILSASSSDSHKVEELREEFIKSLIDNFKISLKDNTLVAWILKLLFVQLKDCKNKRSIKELLAVPEIFSDDVNVLSSFFLVNSLEYDDKLEYLLAQYLLLRQKGASKGMLLEAVENSISQRSLSGFEQLNSAFEILVQTLPDLTLENSQPLLELLELFFKILTKDNHTAKPIFVRSISMLLNNYSTEKVNSADLTTFLSVIRELLVSKPFLFSQYCIELLFPLVTKITMANTVADDSLNINSKATSKKIDHARSEVFIECTHLISSVLIFHRYQLSNRNHLVNVVLCQSIELLADNTRAKLDIECSKAVSRLICNFCEPSNVRQNKRDSLSSAISNVKRSIRKHVPVLLLTFIKTSIENTFSPLVKKELMVAIYSIFDILSQTELNLINASLDSAGRIYFRSLHADYKRVGKWQDD